MNCTYLKSYHEIVQNSPESYLLFEEVFARFEVRLEVGLIVPKIVPKFSLDRLGLRIATSSNARPPGATPSLVDNIKTYFINNSHHFNTRLKYIINLYYVRLVCYF